MVFMWGMRVLVKTLYDVAFSSDKGLRTLIYGVGDQGIGLAKNIRNIKPTQFQLKGFISHDKNYEGRILLGEKVYKPNNNWPTTSRTCISRRCSSVRLRPTGSAMMSPYRTCSSVRV